MDEYSNNYKNNTNDVWRGYTVLMPDPDEGRSQDYDYLGFGATVRYHRKRLNMTQEDVARRLDVGTSTVAWYERQRKPINNPFLIYELADLFGIPADDLREGRVQRAPAREQGMAEYIEGVVQGAPEGVDRDALRELLTVAADLPADALSALVAFGEFQRERGRAASSTRRRKAASGGDTGGDNSGDTVPPSGE
jgi:transcriptional regulator with XRE-family HTH domain